MVARLERESRRPEGQHDTGVLMLVNLVEGWLLAGRDVDVELSDGSSLARLRAGGLLANESGGWWATSRCDDSIIATRI